MSRKEYEMREKRPLDLVTGTAPGRFPPDLEYLWELVDIAAHEGGPNRKIRRAVGAIEARARKRGRRWRAEMTKLWWR